MIHTVETSEMTDVIHHYEFHVRLKNENIIVFICYFRTIYIGACTFRMFGFLGGELIALLGSY